jgi:hypothetical protein
MTEADQVHVFNFRLMEGHPENQRLAPFKATRARIRALGGDLLPATRQSVPADELDEEGRYRRVPSGWADLD